MLNALRSALLTAVVLSAPAYAQDVSTMSPEEALPFLDAMTPEELLPLAQKEGQVVVFSLSSRIARIEAAFEAQYPGIDLVGIDLSSAAGPGCGARVPVAPAHGRVRAIAERSRSVRPAGGQA